MTLLSLIAAYVLIAVLLLNVGLRSHWRWPVKLSVIVVTSAFYFVTWRGLQQVQGWPADSQLPDEFHLIGAHIEQPNKRVGTPGAIYLWVVAADAGAARTDAAPPRAYHLPYREALHQDIIAAQASGKVQLGRQVQRKDKHGNTRQDIVFETLRQAKLPPKR